MENNSPKTHTHDKNSNLDTHIQGHISDVLYNSIVRINFTVNGEKFTETGFFIKINIKNKFRYFLITCYHINAEKFINKKMIIALYYGRLSEEKKFEVILDRKERCIKCFDKPFDVTLIEIIEKDKINKDKFLEPDLNYKKGYLYYKNKFFYIVCYNHNENEKEIKVSSGKITKILNESEFEYSLNTECCNIGSPIILSYNLLVIGNHKQGNIAKSIKKGIFLGYILDIIEKDEIGNKKNKLKGEGSNKKEKIKDKYWNNEELLKNIKSKYIMIKVISNLNYKIKLYIFKYNKRIQNIMNVNLSNYKFLSGRYIEYETNIKGKEYNGYTDNVIYEGGIIKGKRNGKGKEFHETGDIIFEGEYLNGKRNGKGKEYYYSGKVLFEGEYSNGKRLKGKIYDIKGNISYDLENLNGLIKRYYPNGEIEFEGEYLNGKRNGKGKEYNEYGHLIFEGEYLNGERNGKGKEYFGFELIFEGEYLNGNRWNGKRYKGNNSYILKNGIGYEKQYNRNVKLLFVGKYLNGKRNGKWKEYYSNDQIKFEGEYVNGQINGEIKMYNYDGILELEGEYLNGEKNGFGKEFYDNGNLLFEGEYLNGRWNGKVKEYNRQGDLLFEGEYLNGERNGEGKEYNSVGDIIFEGEYLNNKRWKGKGKEYGYNGSLVFEGEYLNGERHGEGKEYYNNGNILFDGEYKNGKLNGEGAEYYKDCNIKYIGEFLDGKWNGKGKEYFQDGQLKFYGEFLNGNFISHKINDLDII